jgi:hypothetical protein
MIIACEHCNSEGAEIPFDWVLDRVTDHKGSTTDYLLESAAKCPNCKREIFEKTLVEPLHVSRDPHFQFADSAS